MRTISLAAACLTLLAADSANAQVHFGHHTLRPGYPTIQYYVASPHHASTAWESYARGNADVIRARGQYNLLSSQAMINRAVAQRRATENRVAQTEAYFRMREINRSHRDRNRTTRSNRYPTAGRERVTHVSEASKPEKLDLRKGRIVWPKAFQDPTFESLRKVVEEIVQRRATSGNASEADRSTLTQVSLAMVSKLRERIHECSPQEYVDAKLFLKALRLCQGELS